MGEMKVVVTNSGQQAQISFSKAKFSSGAPRTVYLSMNYQW
jgi:hypothetical protein